VDKRSLSQPVFDGDDVPVIEVEGLVESSEGCLNLSGDSAISATSVVSSASTFEPPADIVSLYSFALDQFLYCNYYSCSSYSFCRLESYRVKEIKEVSGNVGVQVKIMCIINCV